MSLAPDIASRVAKLLRLACSTGPDGEKLAALNRLGAIAEAQGVNWDQALANGGSGPALTEVQMSRIYSEGYARGHADGLQEARPARDWTPADNSSAEAGEDADRLETILMAAARSAAAGLLSEWESTFSADMLDRFEKYGSRLYVSEKQWSVLDRLETKLRRQDFID